MEKNEIVKIGERIAAIENRVTKLLEENVKDIKELKALLSELEELKKKLSTMLKDKIVSILPEVKDSDLNEKRIKELENYFKIIDNFEGINKFYDINSLLYILSNPQDLNEFNRVLKEIISVFGSYEITLTKDDFNITKYVNEYMVSFFENENEDKFLKIMKDKFDKIYWNSHDLLDDIVLNIRIIIFNNADNMVVSLTNKKNEYAQKNNINESSALDEYNGLIIRKEEIMSIDPVEILKSIKKGNIDVEAITETSGIYMGAVNTFTTEEKYAVIEKQDFFNNIINLKSNLIEFNFYEKYKYLIDFIAEIAEKKEEFKTIYTDKKNNIKKLLEDKNNSDNILNKLIKDREEVFNKKTSLFFSDKKKQIKLDKLDKTIEETLNNTSTMLESIKSEFDGYDLALFEEKSSLSINKGFSILDDFRLFKNNVFVLNETIKKYELNLTNLEIKAIYDKFHEFLKLPSIQIINSFDFYKNEDLASSIVNKYKLIDINFELFADNVEELIRSCDIIIDYYNVSRCGIDPEIISLIDKYYINKEEN